MFTFDNIKQPTIQEQMEKVQNYKKEHGVSDIHAAIKTIGLNQGRMYWSNYDGCVMNESEFKVMMAIEQEAVKAGGVCKLSNVKLSKHVTNINQGEIVSRIIPKLESVGLICVIGFNVYINAKMIDVWRELTDYELNQADSDSDWLSKQDVAEIKKALKLYRYVKNLK